MFKDMEDEGRIDTSPEIGKECLWYCFAKLIQADCNKVKDLWNSHYIRKSRFQTTGGRPDSLLYLPERHGATAELLISVPCNEWDYAANQLLDQEEETEYQEYFEYVPTNLHIDYPTAWEAALELYARLIDVSKNGCA
eukprot:gene3978-4527_t